MRSVVLCIDEVSLAHPECVGLDGESLVAQPWLRVFSEATMARRALAKAREVAEVWVASNDEVEPINLAAALKGDCPARPVFLISDESSGSLMSRANSAGLDGVLSRAEFVSRYARWKREDQRAALEILETSRGSKVGDGGVGAMLCDGGSARPEPDIDDESDVFVRPVGKHAARQRALPPIQRGCEEPLPPVALGRGGLSENCPSLGVSPGENSLSREDQGMCVGGRGGVAPQMALARRGFLLPVISASGGSGKSSVAALAAMLTCRAGLKTLILDLDLQFGDMREIFDDEQALGIDEVLATPMRVEHLTSTQDKPAILCSPRNLESAEDVTERLSELLDLVCPRFDVVVANTGGFWADEHLVLLERCSRALFLVDQRPSSLRACQRALDLCNRCGIAISPLLFVVNKCSKQGLYTSIDVSCALHGASVRELYWGGVQVGEMLATGRALELMSSRNALVESLEETLGELIPNMPQLDSARSTSRFSLWGMLTGRSKEEQPCP